MSMPSPKVSVLIPIYNAQDYLRQCLDAVCGQTYRNLEIICINDGSTDTSPAIIAEFAAVDPRIVRIDKENSGYGDSMNQGVAKATGDYIGIVEPDDYPALNMYEVYVRAAMDAAADVVRSNYYEVVDGEDRLVDLFAGMDIPYGQGIDPRDYPQILLARPCIWSGLYRADLIRDNSIEFATTPGAAFQDTSFAQMTLMAAQTVVVLQQAFMHYRVDNQASSSNSTDKVYLVCDEFDRALDFLRRRPVGDLEVFGPVVGALRMGSYMWNFNRIAPDYRGAFANKWIYDMVDLEAEGLIDFDLLDGPSRRLLGHLADDPESLVVALSAEKEPQWIHFIHEPLAEKPRERAPYRIITALRRKLQRK